MQPEPVDDDLAGFERSNLFYPWRSQAIVGFAWLLMVPVYIITIYFIIKLRSRYNIRARGFIRMTAEALCGLCFIVKGIFLGIELNLCWEKILDGYFITIMSLLNLSRIIVLLFRFRITRKLVACGQLRSRKLHQKHRLEQQQVKNPSSGSGKDSSVYDSDESHNDDNERSSVMRNSLNAQEGNFASVGMDSCTERDIVHPPCLSSSSLSSSSTPSSSSSSSSSTSSCTLPTSSTPLPLSAPSGSSSSLSSISKPTFTARESMVVPSCSSAFSSSPSSSSSLFSHFTTNTIAISPTIDNPNSNQRIEQTTSDRRNTQRLRHRRRTVDLTGIFDGPDGWFLRHRYLISPHYQFCTCTVLSLICVIISVPIYFLGCQTTALAGTVYRGCLAGFFGLCMMICASRVRPDDGEVLGIKTEINILGALVVSVTCTTMPMFSLGIISQFVYSCIWLMFLTCCFIVSLTWPVIVAYKTDDSKHINNAFPNDLKNIRTLEHLLYYDLGYNSFLTYTAQEFAHENVLFWKMCKDFKKKFASADFAVDEIRRVCMEDVQTIMNQFISDSALSPLNISADCRNSLLDAWKHAQTFVRGLSQVKISITPIPRQNQSTNDIPPPVSSTSTTSKQPLPNAYSSSSEIKSQITTTNWIRPENVLGTPRVKPRGSASAPVTVAGNALSVIPERLPIESHQAVQPPETKITPTPSLSLNRGTSSELLPVTAPQTQEANQPSMQPVTSLQDLVRHQQSVQNQIPQSHLKVVRDTNNNSSGHSSSSNMSGVSDDDNDDAVDENWVYNADNPSISSEPHRPPPPTQTDTVSEDYRQFVITLRTMFDQALQETYELMNTDLLPRYIRSPHFVEFVKNFKQLVAERQNRRKRKVHKSNIQLFRPDSGMEILTAKQINSVTSLLLDPPQITVSSLSLQPANVPLASPHGVVISHTATPTSPAIPHSQEATLNNVLPSPYPGSLHDSSALVGSVSPAQFSPEIKMDLQMGSTGARRMVALDDIVINEKGLTVSAGVS